MGSSDSSGRSLEEVRDAVERVAAPGAPVTAREIAAELGCSPAAAADRLAELAGRGVLETEAVGDGRAWWRPANGAPTDDDDDGPSEGDAGGDDVDSDFEDDAGAETRGDFRVPLIEALDGADVGVFVLNADLEVVGINDVAERYFGLDRASVVGRDKRRLVREEIADVVAEPAAFAEAVLSTYEDDSYRESFECRVTSDEDCEERRLEHRSKAIESGAYAGGRVELYYDVTDRANRDERLREVEAFADSILENQRDPIYAFDVEGNFLRWNDRFEAVTGYDGEEIREMRPIEFVAEDAREETAAAISRVLESGESEVLEVPILTADGDRIPYEVSGAPLTTDGRVRGLTGIARDVSGRKARERQLRCERNRVERILEASPAALAIFDAEGRLLRANAPAEAALGVDADGEYEAGDARCLAPDGRVLPLEERPLGHTLATGEPAIEWEVQLAPDADADPRWFSVTTVPVRDDEGALDQVVLSAEDVTRLKEQARRLERQRDDLESELREVFERVDDAFVALDGELRFVYVNERATEVLDRPETDLLGSDVRDAFPAIGGDRARRAYERAMETQEPTAFEVRDRAEEAWFEVRAYPSASGLSVYFRDVSERKAREQQLERYRTVVETLRDGVYALDPDGRFVMANESFLNLTGYDREELLGEPAAKLHGEDVAETAAEMAEGIAAGERDSGVLEVDLTTADGESVPVEARFGLYEYGDGELGRTGVVRDIAERKRFEETLTSLHAATRELFSTDCERQVGEVVLETVADVLGVPGAVVYRHDPTADRLVPVAETSGASFVSGGFPELPADGGSIAGAAFRTDESRYCRDVTDAPQLHVDASCTEMRTGAFVPMDEHVLVVGAREVDAFDEDTRHLLDLVGANAEAAYERVEREQELRDRIRQQEVAADLGRRALEGHDIDGLIEEATELTADALDADYCTALELGDDGEELQVRTTAGWPADVVGTTVPIGATQAEYTLTADGPVVVEDLTTETRFEPGALAEQDVRSGISVAVGTSESPWGVLGVHDTTPREFSEHDVVFVQSVANVLSTAIERRANERRLRQQRERLVALNNLSAVVRGITDAAIERSTRDEIEAVACERLADVDSYEFAWIAEVDPATGRIEARQEAGVDGYLDAIRLSTDSDDPAGRGPAGNAVRSRELQVSSDVFEDPDFEPWRSAAREYGYRSVAVVPIVHEGTLYGLLGIYADRPGAFAGEERHVVDQLGDVIGHAIAAIERKRALMSDEVVEVEFRIPGLFETLAPDAPTDGRITLDRMVSLEDEEYIAYGTATSDAVDGLRALADRLTSWRTLSFLDGGDEEGNRNGNGNGSDGRRFELRLSEPSVLSAVASRGGSIERAVIEDGDYRVTVQFSPTVDVRRVIDAIEEGHPDVDLVTRRQVAKRDAASVDPDALVDALTDRQRSALEVAYYSGYFEWPRDSTAEDVAESLDVTSPTVHKHLRRAQRKVFGTLLDG